MLHNKKQLAWGLLSLTSVVLFSGIARAEVVASIKPLGFIAAAVADGVTPVKVLLPEGASEHDYSLRPSDIKAIRNAELVVWVGPDMEAFMPKIIRQIPKKKSLEIADLTEVKPLLMRGSEDDDGVDATSHHDHEYDSEHHHHGEYNMHLWLSPEIAKYAAVAIHAKLLELMPQNKDKLDANLQYFEASLAQSDIEIEKQLTPVKNKGYFVFHDAYGYFEKHYGLSPVGHFTVNPEIQPGAQHLHFIRTQLVEQKAVCVFAEPQFRPAVIDAVARGTKVLRGTLDPLGMGIRLGKDSYVKFLSQLSSQYTRCLKGA